MRAVVVKPYECPYENPISVAAGAAVIPDFDKRTDIAGWVWCTAEDGRSGWTPHNWLLQSGNTWRIDRNFNAIELSVIRDEMLDTVFEESEFFWARKANGESGWIPCENVSVIGEASGTGRTYIA